MTGVNYLAVVVATIVCFVFSPSLAPDLDGAIFIDGGPTDWQGPGHGFSVVQVAAASRDGLPARAFLAVAPVYRTDRLGTVELIDSGGGFVRSPLRSSGERPFGLTGGAGAPMIGAPGSPATRAD
jgi:hypothetical protein